MLLVSAYRAEINYWKHANWDYVALGHNNLNVDNCYFWRNDMDELDVGVFDFGGFGVGSLSHKLWWCIYAEDFDCLHANIIDYIDTFIFEYQRYGGPSLDRQEMYRQTLITCMECCWNMVNGVPNCVKMVGGVKEFASIKDKYDPRIAGNIDGKSTHRTTCFVMNSTIRIIEELGGDAIVKGFIEDFIVQKQGWPAKSDE